MHTPPPPPEADVMGDLLQQPIPLKQDLQSGNPGAFMLSFPNFSVQFL